MLPLIAWLAFPAAALPQHLADAVSTGDCAAVLADLPEPAADDERLAVGWCHVRAGAPSQARPLLQAITDPAYDRYGRLVLAQALAPWDRAPEPGVAELLDGVELPGDAAAEVRMLRARSLAWQPQTYDVGRRELNALISTDRSGEARYTLASAALDVMGKYAGAIEVWRTSWATDVKGDWDDRAASKLTELGVDPTDLSKATNRKLARERVASLQAANQHDQALALLRELEKQEPGSWSGTSLAHAEFKGRDYPAATASFRKTLGEPSRAEGRAKDLYHYALGTARTGDYDTAAQVYTRLYQQHPQTKRGDTASYKLGYMEYDRRDCAKAVPLFEQHLVRYPSSRHADEALWFMARCAWSSQDLPAARRSWDRLVADHPKSSLAPGAAYWSARAGGDAAALQAIVNRYPTSGYAWFAAHRTGRTFPAKAVVERPPWPASLADRDEVKRAEALLAAGFKDWARAELQPVRALAKDDRSAALAAAHALIAAGDYRAGRSLAEPWCVAPWKDGDPVAQQACTPRPEGSIVARVATQHGLDPLVPFGIMTAESALDPSVTSIAGARGLMQLMPKEAARIHTSVWPDRAYNAIDLYSAPYNATLGTTELGQKHKLWKGRVQGTQLPATIASYNGGPEAVERWLAAYEAQPEFDEFAEDIGYTETRQYVKRVLGYTMAYRWVYGDQEAR